MTARTKPRDPRCVIRRSGIRLKHHRGPETDANEAAKIVTTAALMRSVARGTR